MEERNGWLPIHYASRWGDLKMLNYLIKSGANINGLTNSKETALHKCARWERKDVAITLLKLGAISTIKNKDGEKASDLTVDTELKFILDYFPIPHGRGWRCDRSAWSVYTKEEIHGAPMGDWIHFELSPKMADDAEAMRAAFNAIPLQAQVI
jgi:ankyrin repeat protein